MPEEEKEKLRAALKLVAVLIRAVVADDMETADKTINELVEYLAKDM